MAKRLIDLTGKRFGRLIVLKRVANDNHGNLRWECICDCGNKKIIRGANLRGGLTSSCGCYNYEQSVAFGKKWGGHNKIHGMKHIRLYYLWSNMKARCYNSKADSFEWYGAKGIKVCDEWKHDFLEFHKWAMANGYKDNLSIDRLDNTKDYSPENCKWSTVKEQQNNRSNNHIVNFNGATYTLAELADKFKIDYQLLWDRLKRGWEIERAVNTSKLIY